MYYSRGNYEAFARPRKPEGVDAKSAYIIGSGLAALATAAFLIRDGQMAGTRIHILEELEIAGGACDGIDDPQKGLVIRGGREMEDHFECLWDLFHSIPSLEIEGASVLDEFYWLNKKDPNFTKMRAIAHRGKDAGLDFKFGLSDAAILEISKLFLASDEELYDVKINEVFSDEVLKSNYWLYWRTMFAFEEWHSALEMRRYIQRFIHHIGGMPDFSALKFTTFNQYESLILPLVSYLEKNGVEFSYGTRVRDVVFDIKQQTKTATQLICEQAGAKLIIDLSDDDLLFITNGSCTESSSLGDNDNPPRLIEGGGCWDLWRNIAAQDASFGRPEKFCEDVEASKWESATVSVTSDEIIKRVSEISGREVFTGGVVTGGIVTVQDSSWLLSYSVSRQPHFKAQPKGTMVVWLYGLFPDATGDFVKKPMQECTGQELVQEWLYHLGIEEDRIVKMAREGTSCIPCMLPYITAFFMPRAAGDRPLVVPEGSSNFAFIGQFTETERDTVFTTEYSVRTAMESVYTLLGVDRGVPETFGSTFDVRYLLDASVKLKDGEKLSDMQLPLVLGLLERQALKVLQGTLLEELLKKYGAI